MAPGRRSQGPPPPPPPTPPRQSKRPRVPSGRAAANAATAASAGRGRGRGGAGGRRPPAEPVIDDGENEAQDPTPDPLPQPLPRMPAPPARHVGPTASLKRKKDQLRQMEDRRSGKTKPYAATYDSRGAAAREGLFGAAARGPLGDAARRREWEADERKKEARLRVEIRLEETRTMGGKRREIR